MNYDNGFYIYTPNEDAIDMCPLNLHQVIEINNDEISLTGMDRTFNVDYAEAIGTIGRMVLTPEGGQPMQQEINFADECHFDEITVLECKVADFKSQVKSLERKLKLKGLN
jgi:hypothetical protein